MLVNSHLRCTRNPDFILSTMWVCQAVLRSLLRVFRAVPLPPALTLPLPLNPTPPPASIHGNRARGFPKHLARGFDVRRAWQPLQDDVRRSPWQLSPWGCCCRIWVRRRVSWHSSVWVTLIYLFIFIIFKHLYFVTRSPVSFSTPPTQQ